MSIVKDVISGLVIGVFLGLVIMLFLLIFCNQGNCITMENTVYIIAFSAASGLLLGFILGIYFALTKPKFQESNSS